MCIHVHVMPLTQICQQTFLPFIILQEKFLYNFDFLHRLEKQTNGTNERVNKRLWVMFSEYARFILHSILL